MDLMGVDHSTSFQDRDALKQTSTLVELLRKAATVLENRTIGYLNDAQLWAQYETTIANERTTQEEVTFRRKKA